MHSTPTGPDVSGAEEDAPAAFRSPSPEDADAVRVGSPRDDGEGDGGQQQQATPLRSGGPLPGAASPAAACSSPAGGMEASAADALLSQGMSSAATPPSRAGFPGFAMRQGLHCFLATAAPHWPLSICHPGSIAAPADAA